MTVSPEHTINTADTSESSQRVPGLASEHRRLGKGQLAALLGCCERSLERLVKLERFPPPRRFGREAVWFEKAVWQFLEQEQEEQLQWCPAPVGLVESPAPAASQVPAAHELEAPAVAQGELEPVETDANAHANPEPKANSKPKPKRPRAPLRAVTGEAVFDLRFEDLALVVNMPTLD